MECGATWLWQQRCLNANSRSLTMLRRSPRSDCWRTSDLQALGWTWAQDCIVTVVSDPDVDVKASNDTLLRQFPLQTWSNSAITNVETVDDTDNLIGFHYGTRPRRGIQGLALVLVWIPLSNQYHLHIIDHSFVYWHKKASLHESSWKWKR
jgi:uncharacterized protein (UPF0548 family)